MEKQKRTAENKKEKRDLYSRVLVCQMALAFAATALFSFMCGAFPEMKEDYAAFMKWDMKNEAAGAVMYLGRLFTYERGEIRSEEGETAIPSDESTSTDSTGEETTELETTATQAVSLRNTALESEGEASVQAMAFVGDGGMDLYDMPEDYGLKDPDISDEILCPIENPRYTSYFGYRINPITGKRSFHTGVDIAADTGTKIRAAFSGKVTKVGEDDRAGRYIFLEHDNGLVTFYCHCSEILAVKGANILQGETVALVGSTGWSTGPHVHFEVRKDGEHIDPMKLLKSDG